MKSHLKRNNKPLKQKSRGPRSPLYLKIRPAVSFLKFFGLWPFEFYEDRMTPSHFFLFFTVIWAIFYSYVIVAVVIRFEDGKKHQKSVLGTIETVKVIINYLVAVSNLGHTVYTRKQFSHIWNLVQEHDEDVARDIGGCRSEMHLSIWMWTVFVMSFSIWNCVSQGGINAFNEPWFQNVSYMMVYVASSLSVIKFSGLVYILGTRFFYLNSVAYAHAMGDTTIGHKTSSKVVERLYEQLLLIGETFRDLYSWPLMIWISNLCLHSVSNLYFLFDWIIDSASGEDSIQVATTLCILIWIVVYLSQIVLLQYSCEFTAHQANSMGYILTKWRFSPNCEDNGDNSKGIRSTLHWMNRTLNFSAAGCFYVNRSLLGSMAYVFTIYLVLLLQIQEI